MRENRLRRMAERQGYALRKSRRRDPRALDYGGYMLTKVKTDEPIFGAGDFPFSATLDDIEAFLTRDD